MSTVDNMEMGKKVLRYKIVNAECVKSSDGEYYRYIYTINNLLALKVYSLYGISLQTHFSRNFQQTVLRIKNSDIEKLSKEQQDFLNETAPVIPHDEQYRKYTYLVLCGKLNAQTKERSL
ncbi:MAG: hypothetical protein MJ156_02750 [Alphaproteobacteria bacterium]|nr:hypothetical protein [Alphaproteobacteria bacterium]